MKKYQIIITLFLFISHCMAQNVQEKLLGTWQESHRDYVYFKTDMAYGFTKVESEIFKDSKIAFTKDTMYAYVTYLLENTMNPILYEMQDIKTDTVDLNHGNLSVLLQKKGKYCKGVTVKKKTFNGYKEYYAKYSFYLFEDGSMGFLRDFSLHYFNKISNENIGKWDENEFGQSIINAPYSGFLSIENEANKSFLQVLFFPAKTGKNNCQIDYINKNDIKNNIVFKLENELSKEIISVYFKNNNDIKRFELFVGSSRNPIDSRWEVRYKFIDKIGKIISTKSTIYKTPNIPTKMYLLKGNEVEVLEQKDNWLHIRYYGNKTIEGWIKKEDVGEK